MILKSERRRGKFDDFTTRAHRIPSHAQSLTPSRARSLFRRMRVFSDDSAALQCARQVQCRYPAAYGTVVHQSERCVRTSSTTSRGHAQHTAPTPPFNPFSGASHE